MDRKLEWISWNEVSAPNWGHLHVMQATPKNNVDHRMTIERPWVLFKHPKCGHTTRKKTNKHAFEPCEINRFPVPSIFHCHQGPASSAAIGLVVNLCPSAIGRWKCLPQRPKVWSGKLQWQLKTLQHAPSIPKRSPQFDDAQPTIVDTLDTSSAYCKGLPKLQSTNVGCTGKPLPRTLREKLWSL